MATVRSTRKIRYTQSIGWLEILAAFENFRMSRYLVKRYHEEIDRLVRHGGSRKETSIRTAFERLLNEYCRPRNYMLVPELDYKTKFDTTVYPDGTIKDAIRLEHGWWESKDQYDNLEREIEAKFQKGYPNENILFEDSQTAILIQHGKERSHVSMRDAEKLDRLITTFVDYERPEVRDFRAAIAKFRDDIPHILEALREEIKKAESENAKFRDRRNAFLDLCRQSINPEIEIFDIHEMLIQHILTEDIFTNIFHDAQFHRENNIAREISEILNTFFTGAARRNVLRSIEHYYAVIRRKSENIANHHEKQKFLKAVYENFYKAYNPKAADRLGIVYTPNEIVRFMVESADYLVHKHFGKLLSDPGVEILDPCTGTGTYITELIEYLPPDALKHKYKHEIHCNEVAILPYYIANLNIEFTYQQKMGTYEEFKNICLVDTLDHCGFEGKQFDLFAMSVQNTARIQDQNASAISVIIGNPPYNANQADENDNNKNRFYESVDKRIKQTYIQKSSAQKTKIYDPYARFFRWCSDRLDTDGILVFITNSSFVEKSSFDGFRKSIFDEFSEVYIIDLGGDVRINPKISGKAHNVFGIQTGVAISLMVKKSSNSEKSEVFYTRRPEFETADEKLKFLTESKFDQIRFERIQPDRNSNWLHLTSNDFEDLVILIDKQVKRSKRNDEAIFKIFSLGILTGRDEWVYDFSRCNLVDKMKFFFSTYQEEMRKFFTAKGAKIKEFKIEDLSQCIKWTRALKNQCKRGANLFFEEKNILEVSYRPFAKKFLYYSKSVNEVQYQVPIIFPLGKENRVIYCTDAGTQSPFMVIATRQIPDSHFVGTTAQCLPLYRYDKDGNRIDNITDWGLTQFHDRYSDNAITKEDIFHYTYAVLHHPAYRNKYEINLKREFPRLPFYPDFQQWVAWGKDLTDLHLNYETVVPYGLERHDIPPARKAYKAKLKADKEKGQIVLDTETTLVGVPAAAWTYQLGNRSALEWILDQYKEKKPRDPTIREKFDTYRFSDYKERAIDLLQRVCTVSVETMKIIRQMPAD